MLFSKVLNRMSGTMNNVSSKAAAWGLSSAVARNLAAAPRIYARRGARALWRRGVVGHPNKAVGWAGGRAISALDYMSTGKGFRNTMIGAGGALGTYGIARHMRNRNRGY